MIAFLSLFLACTCSSPRVPLMTSGSVAQDADALYLPAPAPGGLLRVLKADTKAAVLLTKTPAGAVDVDGTNVYFGAADGLRVITTSGNGEATLVSGTIHKIQHDDDAIYYFEGTDARILRLDKRSGFLTTLVSDHPYFNLVLAGDHVYFTRGSALQRVPKTGGTAVVVDVAASELFADSDSVYYRRPAVSGAFRYLIHENVARQIVNVLPGIAYDLLATAGGRTTTFHQDAILSTRLMAHFTTIDACDGVIARSSYIPAFSIAAFAHDSCGQFLVARSLGTYSIGESCYPASTVEIHAVSPRIVHSGGIVSLTGSNFGALPQVEVDGRAATVVLAKDDRIDFIAPPGQKQTTTIRVKNDRGCGGALLHYDVMPRARVVHH